MATISKLPSGSWPAHVRRKGNYVSETFLRRGDAELWARSVESRIDRGETIHAGARAAKTFGDLIAPHKADLAEVGKPLERSKAASLDVLALRICVRRTCMRLPGWAMQTEPDRVSHAGWHQMHGAGCFAVDLAACLCSRFGSPEHRRTR
ncbi:MAG: hypothetical protein R3D85_10895 [Paracoccaceae bacterium]